MVHFGVFTTLLWAASGRVSYNGYRRVKMDLSGIDQAMAIRKLDQFETVKIWAGSKSMVNGKDAVF